MASSSLKSLVESYVSLSASGKGSLKQIIDFLKDNQERDILSLIITLGPFLTSEIGLERRRATCILAEVLDNLPDFPLNSQAISTIISFCVERFQDEISCGEAIKGLVAILKFHNVLVSDDDYSMIVESLLVHCNIKSLPQPARYSVFQLFILTIDQSKMTLLGLGNLFIRGFISAVEGEKDPRNLSLLFPLFQRIISIFPRSDFDGLEELLFDLISCYFPVTFKGSRDQKNQVDVKSLALDLRKCLAAHEMLAPYVIPFFDSKLDSLIPRIRIECLHALQESIAPVGPFHATSFEPHISSIWTKLCDIVMYAVDVKEVTKSGEDDDAKKKEKEDGEQQEVEIALSVIKSLFSCFCSSDSNTSTTTVSSSVLAELLANSALEELKSPDSKKARAFSNILFASFSVSDHVSSCVLNAFWTPFIELIASCGREAESEETDEASTVNTHQRRALFEVLCNIVTTICIPSPTLSASSSPSTSTPLLPYLGPLYDLLTSDISQAQTPSSISALCCLISSPQLITVGSLPTTSSSPLSLEQVEKAVLMLTQLAITAGEEEEQRNLDREEEPTKIHSSPTRALFSLRDHILQSLVKVSSSSSSDFLSLLHSHTIVEISSRISQSSPPHIFINAIRSATILAGISGALKVFSHPLFEVLEHEFPLFLSATTPSPHTMMVTVALKSASIMLENTPWKQQPPVFSLEVFARQFFPFLLEMFVTASSSTSSSTFGEDKWVVEPLSLFLRTLTYVAGSNAHTQSASAVAEVQLFLLSEILPCFFASPRPLLLSFLEPILVALNRGTVDEFVAQNEIQFINLLSELKSLAIPVKTEVDATTTTAAAAVLSTMINKAASNTLCVEEFVTQSVETCFLDLSVNAMSLLGWVCKALLMKSNAKGIILMTRICELVGSNSNTSEELLASAAVDAIATIMTEHSVFLNSKRFDVRDTTGWIEQAFDGAFPVLLGQIERKNDVKQRDRVATEPSLSSNLLPLLALTHLLTGAPLTVIHSKLEAVFPLLLQTLSLCDSFPELVHSTLSILCGILILPDALTLASQHVESLVISLIQLTQYKPMMQIRKDALKCLTALQKLPIELMAPYKGSILNGMRIVVGDHKRLVRQEAVICVNKWFLYFS